MALKVEMYNGKLHGLKLAMRYIPQHPHKIQVTGNHNLETIFLMLSVTRSVLMLNPSRSQCVPHWWYSV